MFSSEAQYRDKVCDKVTDKVSDLGFDLQETAVLDGGEGFFG
jgi:hypothetical protein